MTERIQSLKQRVLDGGSLERDEAQQLFDVSAEELGTLFEAASEIRDARARRSVDLCSIVNAKSGGCPEDCGFCSQSIHFNAEVPSYPMMELEKILRAADEAADNGATKFGVVIAKRGPNDTDIRLVCDAVREIRKRGRIIPDASLGILTREQAQRLADAGMDHYNHNLETSRRHFAKICSTHDYESRVQTIRYVKEAGMKTCSGGIFNMGEDAEDRVDLAFTLLELGVDTIPINFLNPIPGTPMANQPRMDPLEALQCVAVWRFLFPEKELRICGGRETVLGDLQNRMFDAGANATMVGNYLTTLGATPAADRQMILEAGYRLAGEASGCGSQECDDKPAAPQASA